MPGRIGRDSGFFWKAGGVILSVSQRGNQGRRDEAGGRAYQFRVHGADGIVVPTEGARRGEVDAANGDVEVLRDLTPVRSGLWVCVGVVCSSTFQSKDTI